MTYNHAEAFCLMKYRSDDGEEEIIWNSRDGVTPFTITLPSGKSATHVDWNRDVRMPEDYPAPGVRRFVDLTPERAREAAERMVERNWNHPQYSMSESGRTKAEWVELLVADYGVGEPDLVDAP